MVAYVNGETDLRALMRVGGDLETIKRFVAAGFPVLVEKGFEGARFDGWMGHYEVVSGYDDSQEEFFVYDSFVGPENAFSIPYEQIDTYWRHFNNTYIIIYPPEREEQVMTLLGPHADELYNYQQAAQRASDEIFTFVDRRRVFAWFNRGTNLVYLDDYAGAAAAYDEYFKLYAELSEKERPWRNLWYQSGPYWAYYYTQRYYDVIDLATKTIDAASEPAIEESWYWRALAKEALGDIDGAIADLEQAVDLNENFGVGWYHLERIRGGG
jgi:tetratricopeptide (TPR) repeat protein